MKYEKLLSGLTAAALAFILSYGTVGAMVTAFDLSVGSMGLLCLLCGLISALGALCFQLRRGSLVLLCGAALLTGFLWRSGAAVEQTLSLLYQVSKIYDGAYGWGVFYYGSGAGPVGYPMGILGAVTAITVSWTVCRRQSIWPAAAAVLVPLCACLVVMNTVPEEGYLYLLLLGFLTLVMTNTVRRKNALQGVTLTAMVSAPLALALLAAFWLAPKESYVNRVPELQQQTMDLYHRVPELWEQITEQAGMDIANDRIDSVDLESLGSRPDLSYEVMAIFGTVDGQLYLRGQDYDIYSGTGWMSSMGALEDFPSSPEQLITAGAVTIETRRTRDLLYLPYYPTEPVAMSGAAYNSDQVRRYVFTRGVLPQGWQSASYRDADALTEGQSYKEAEAEKRYLSLPESTRAWSRTLLGSVLSDGMTRTQQADAIAAYVRASACYDLETERMPADAEDFAVWFLEAGETGYCVHFATAAAVLLRAAGIPARYVTGYMITAEAGSTVTVTAREAHAWVEYYEPVVDAWIVLEATPGDGEAPSAPPTGEGTLPPSTEASEPATEATVPPTEATEAPSAPPTVPPEPTSPSKEPDRSPLDLGWLWTLLGWLTVAAALIGAVVLQRLLRLRLRKRRQESAAPNALALLLWREALLREHLLERRPPRELEALAQKAKFSQHTLTEEELQRFRACISEAEAALQAKPWYWQAALRYIFAIY